MNESKQQIWYVMFCDEWQSHDSERLQMITTDPIKVREFIYKSIINKDVEYDMADDASPTDQANRFIYDWERLTRRELNNKLSYCYYDYTYDGDEI